MVAAAMHSYLLVLEWVVALACSALRRQMHHRCAALE
jgi:hypothetical protein